MSFESNKIEIGGKFLRLGNSKWILRGFSYGPFAPNSQGNHLPERDQVLQDFDHIRELGGNGLRVYFPPPKWMLDEALARELRVFVDVPWEKHRCFFEDWKSRQQARDLVAKTARELGAHPACLAISVANEFPCDIVRFYGAQRIGKFVDELLDVVKQNSPTSLATFVNFPTTEFLTASHCDFHCFNIYLNDAQQLGAYLTRLHHIAGDRPLVLAEFGLDSLRHGNDGQQEFLSNHMAQVARSGLAGSIVFSYTDDWFTGGQQVDDWKFGVTDCDRNEKPSAIAIREAWTEPSDQPTNQPMFSVVVCCYNGGHTLAECLHSLIKLSYPNYEVILVDDGSTDGTRQIAAQFPTVNYIHQSNRGLSVARNVGAEHATGEIVAYTDADCVADEDWLTYLAQAFENSSVAVVGGPNITPPSDSWTSKCVAASPGNPCHVMLDDFYAEHVPGCNLAIRRSVLLGMDGFDPQFREAGDDVDFCWRALDAGFEIGFAPTAMVWHHRRETVRAYLKQQRGYGWAESMVQLKHPRRCNSMGRFQWSGIIYGSGNCFPSMTPLIYHGRFGGALFQSIYRNSSFSLLATALSFEWHLLTLFLFSLGIIHGLFVIPGVLMIAASAWVAVTAAYQATLPPRPPWWSRPLIAALHVIQPIARSLRRYKGLYRFGRLPRCFDLRMRSWLPSVRRASESISRKTELADLPNVKCISRSHRDLYWLSRDGVGRESLLSSLLAEAKRLKWAGDFDNPWSPWDLSLVGDIWHRLTIRSVSEELGNNERFTRVRISTQPTVYLYSICAAAVIWLSVALCTLNYWAIGIGIIAMLFALLKIHLSRQFCLSAACVLSAKAAELIDLPTYDWRRSPSDVVRLDESNELPPRKQRELEQVGP